MSTIVPIQRTLSAADLSSVLLGKTRGAVLSLLLGRPDGEYHVRQIARLSGAALGPTQRELKLLARVGVLKSRLQGRQLLYRADPTSPVYHELRSLVVKTVGMSDVLKEALSPLATQIRVAFVFGSFARSQHRAASDVDLMVIGDLTFAALATALRVPQKSLGRDVNPSLYRPSEFSAKLNDGHHFLNAVVDGPKLFLIGDQNDLSRLAE